MKRKHVIITIIATGIFLALLFGASSLLTALSYAWAGRQVVLSVPMQTAVNAAYFVQRFAALIAIFVTGGSLGLAWLLSRTFSKS